jgi:predicted  nucleic acid-binding Zn-ribbon protein
MGLLIRNLLALQEVDLQIISLSEEKKKLLDSTEQKRSDVDEQRIQLERREQQLKRLKVEMKSCDVELGEAGDRIKKLEGQQIHVKTNQEYKALDKEIYEAKARQAQTEEILLEKMELLEEETAGVRERRQELDARVSQLEEETAAVNDKVHEIDNQIGELKTRRSEIAASVEAGHLRLYDRILNNKKGPALVPVVNRSCQGCHLAVPAAVESVLRRHASNIVVCENCARILYVPDEEEAEND